MHFGSIKPHPLSDPRLLVVADQSNDRTAAWAEKLAPYVHTQPDIIAVVGGDGFMLRTIRRLCHRRLPFLGINAGHHGFLLNDLRLDDDIPSEINIHHLPMLEVVAQTSKGRRRILAFNDAWVERAKSQTAWVKVTVNGVVRLEKLVADAALVATPSGSTAYARAMGASPLPLDAQALVLAGSNVASPVGLRPCYLPLGSSIEFSALDPVKRPLWGVADGVRLGTVMSLTAVVSQVASVQLAFASSYDLTEKLATIQFPNR